MYIIPNLFTAGKKPSKERAIWDYLLICNNIPSFDEFTILTYGHHKCILKIKESLLTEHDRPVLKKNVSSDKLFFLLLLLYHNIVLFCCLIFILLFDILVMVIWNMNFFEIVVEN